MSEEVKSAREFAEAIAEWVQGGSPLDDVAVEHLTGVILSRDKLIEAEVFHNALECLVDEIETGELLTPKLKAALAEHDREIERKACLAEAETLERERCEIARITVAIKKALQSYEWLIEGRGSYEWDDDRWHDEFEHACHNIRLEIEPLEKIGADLSNRALAASTSSDSGSRCPECGGEITHKGGHGSWCPNICCKWGWETEMDGSPLKPPATQTKEEDCLPYGKPSSGPGSTQTKEGKEAQ